jgi:hypothetical protein
VEIEGDIVNLSTKLKPRKAVARMSFYRLNGNSRRIVSGLTSLSGRASAWLALKDATSCQSAIRTSSLITSGSNSYSSRPNPSSKPSLTGGNEVAELRNMNPHVDVVKYTHKHRVWSLHHVDFYSEALAIGFMENGLISGDVVLSWLPTHFSEQVRSTQ